jgi:hypothetical protein
MWRRHSGRPRRGATRLAKPHPLSRPQEPRPGQPKFHWRPVVPIWPAARPAKSLFERSVAPSGRTLALVVPAAFFNREQPPQKPEQQQEAHAAAVCHCCAAAVACCSTSALRVSTGLPASATRVVLERLGLHWSPRLAPCRWRVHRTLSRLKYAPSPIGFAAFTRGADPAWMDTDRWDAVVSLLGELRSHQSRCFGGGD